MFTEIYDGLFLIGFIGIIAQGFIGTMHGMAHIGQHASGGHGAAASHGHTGSHVHGGSHAHPLHVGGHAASGAHNSGRWTSTILTLLSPMTLFSLCLGSGAAGLIAQHFVPNHIVVAVLALVCGVAFVSLIVQPLLGLIFRFQSKPAEALDGAVAQEAEVVSRFNANGEGVVKLTIDGQIVRILARLEPSDTISPSDIAPGDRLTVTSIDGHANTCRVAKL